jgi:DDE family transposase
MRPRISIKRGMEMLASHSGLIHIGTLLESMNLKESIDDLPAVHCQDPKFSHSEILASMIGLISVGKPDYDAVEIFRHKQQFFTKALGLTQCPSSATIRQRIDLIGHAADRILKDKSAALVGSHAPAISPIETSCGAFVPLDIDVSPFDNSKTSKEGVGRTYKGYDGYAPIFAYGGTEGYLLNLELRDGRQHCQKETPQFIRETIAYAREITDQPILMRLDSGNDSQDNFTDPQQHNVHFIIKRNLRRESRQAWAQLARDKGSQRLCRKGKTVWVGQTHHDLNGKPLPYPIVFEVTERSTHKGQQLLFPQIDVDTYWYSLPELAPREVIALYHDHGTSEQFHSELKSDMGLERLPSGRFASNSLVLLLGMITYNMLRIIGQHSLIEQTKIGPLPGSRRKPVKRRRIRTVMQDLMYMAGRLIHSGRKWFISFGRINAFSALWQGVDRRLRCCSAGA